MWNISLKTLVFPLLFAVTFYSIAFWRYFATGNVFYLYNFAYIGTSLAAGIFLGEALPKKYILWGRRVTQILIGGYMLVYVGVVRHENMQIEGFFFYLFAGVFASATLHYFIAKIVGPLVFSRGWCGWACWTAMVLDLLPWKGSSRRRRRLEIIRYIHFFASLGIVSYLWFIAGRRDVIDRSSVELYWFVLGNVAYYLVALILAFLFKDNRAFCKYVCPVPVFQKCLSRYALLRVKIDADKCTNCRLCEENCPMGIQLLRYKNEGKRVMSTECILCSVCADVCPEKAIRITMKFDSGRVKEYLR